MAVDHDRRVWLVGAQEAVKHLPHRLHLVSVERPLGVQRRVAGGEQQAIALAQRDLEVLGEMKHHLATRPRPSGLEEADVARGDGRVQGEFELAEAAALSPGAKQLADRSGCGARRHAVKLARSRGHRDYLAGNGAAAASPRAGFSRHAGSRIMIVWRCLSGGPRVRWQQPGQSCNHKEQRGELREAQLERVGVAGV